MGCLTLKMKALRFFETLGSIYQFRGKSSGGGNDAGDDDYVLNRPLCDLLDWLNYNMQNS